MTEDKKYPIYEFKARYTMPANGAEHCAVHGLPPGRVWNFVTFNKMFREDQTREALDVVLLEFWRTYRGNKFGAELFALTAELRLRESWCLTWFSHYTFDDGQSDAEVLASFNRYLIRTSIKECLMGAEDRWRWSVPCRCEYCKKHGIVKIDH